MAGASCELQSAYQQRLFPRPLNDETGLLVYRTVVLYVYMILCMLMRSASGLGNAIRPG